MRALDAERRERFVRALEAHLQRYFPAFVAMQPPDSLRASIHQTVEQAASLGLETQGDVGVYLNLCAMLGWNFTSEPRHAWLAELLRDASIPSAAHRLKLGCQELTRRLTLEAQQREALRQFQASAQRKESR